MCDKKSIDIIKDKTLWKSFNFANDDLKGVRGVSVLPDRNFIVADTENNRLLKCGEDGTRSKKVGKKGNGELEFKCPIRVAQCQSTGNLYIPDRDNNRVKIFDSELNFIKTFGAGIVSRPFGAAVSDTRVYITDTFDCNLHEFTLDGEHIRTVHVPNAKGDRKYSKGGIMGVAVDRFGFVLVCVAKPEPRIQVFRPNLTKHVSFGEDVLKTATDICILPDGKVAVSDAIQKKIFIF